MNPQKKREGRGTVTVLLCLVVVVTRLDRSPRDVPVKLGMPIGDRDVTEWEEGSEGDGLGWSVMSEPRPGDLVPVPG